MRGIKVLVLKGDGEGAAKAMGRQVGLGENSIHFQLVPEGQTALRRRYQTNCAQ
jgi:cation transport ATPase